MNNYIYDTIFDQTVTMKVDTVQLFQFKSEIALELAIKESLIEYKGTRIYSTQGSNWVINKSNMCVNFGGDNCPIIGVENDQIIYLSGDEEFRIFLSIECKTGRYIIFFLEPEKNGIIRGGFGYPTNIVGL
jgi:hypothetical protein